MRVYVAGPYSSDPEGNLKIAMEAGLRLADASHAPFVPHLYHYMHQLRALEYETWINIDLAWLRVSEAIIRLPGESNGADIEMDFAQTLHLPRFESVDHFLSIHPHGKGFRLWSSRR